MFRLFPLLILHQDFYIFLLFFLLYYIKLGI